MNDTDRSARPFRRPRYRCSDSRACPRPAIELVVFDSESETREIALKRQQLQREQSLRQVRRLTLDQISKRIADGEVKELMIVLKADVDGSLEAIADTLMEIKHESVGVRIIHRGVGAITESDVLLAEASQAVVLGFHVEPTSKARIWPPRRTWICRLYSIIYDLVNDIKLALEGMLEPEKREEVIGALEVRNIFKASKIGLDRRMLRDFRENRPEQHGPDQAGRQTGSDRAHLLPQAFQGRCP